MFWFFSFLLIILLAFIIFPFIPAAIEYRRRKDKGPRRILDTTIREEEPEITLPTKESIESLSFIEKRRIKSRVKTVGGIMRVVGDLSIPDGTEINMPIVVHGHLRIGKNVIITGTCKTEDSVLLGEGSEIHGNLISGKDVVLNPLSRVDGIIDAKGDVVAYGESYIGAISADKSVKLEPGVKIGTRITAGEQVLSIDRSKSLLELDMSYLNGKMAADEYLKLRRELSPKSKSSKKVTSKKYDKKILKMIAEKKTIIECATRLMINPDDVKNRIDYLIEKGYLKKDKTVTKKGQLLRKAQKNSLGI